MSLAERLRTRNGRPDGFGLGLVCDEAADEIERLTAERDALLAALNAMLTHMGMDEDEWNKPTFDQARAAIDAVRKA